MYLKQIILYLCILVCMPVAAQMEKGSYQGFQVAKKQEQPDIITIQVLSLGNGVCQFSEARSKKPLQGTYHIIIHQNKYNIGNFKKGIAIGDWEEYWYNKLNEKGVYKNGKYDGKVYNYGYDGLENKYPSVYTIKDGVVQHYITYHENGQVGAERFYNESGQLHGEVIRHDKDGKRTYKNKTYKKHPSIQLKEHASGVIDIE